MRTPFIHLLKTINGYYVFDVNRTQIVEVDQRVNEVLKKFDKSNYVASQEDEETLKPYLDEGYFDGSNIQEIRHTLTDEVEYYLNRKLRKITLQVTQNCNLRCSYCIYSDINHELQRTHSVKNMSFETAKKGIDFLKKHSIDSDNIDIGFYGGEPLLRFDFIKEAVKYAKAPFKGKKLSFSITTNGTLFNEQNIEFLMENGVNTLISIDGPEKIHDKNRRFASDGRGSFKKILENIQLIKEKYPSFLSNISINMVVDPQNDYSIGNSLLLENPDLNKIYIRSTLIDDFYSEEKNVYLSNFTEKRIFSQFVALLDYFKMIDNLDVNPLVVGEVGDSSKHGGFERCKLLPSILAPSGPCVPGQLRLFMDVDGRFFPCERVSESSSAMNIGNIDSGFNIQKCKALLNIGSLTAEKCKKCWAISGCTLCAKAADNGATLSGERKSTFCKGSCDSFELKLYNAILKKEISKYYNL